MGIARWLQNLRPVSNLRLNANFPKKPHVERSNLRNHRKPTRDQIFSVNLIGGKMMESQILNQEEDPAGSKPSSGHSAANNEVLAEESRSRRNDPAQPIQRNRTGQCAAGAEFNPAEGQPGWDWVFLPKTSYSRATKQCCSLDGPKRYTPATKELPSLLPPADQPTRLTPDGLPGGIETKPRRMRRSAPTRQPKRPEQMP